MTPKMINSKDMDLTKDPPSFGSEARIAKLVEAGTEIGGSASGAALGFIIGGLPGALAGSASSPLLISLFKKVGSEITKRILGHREQVRVGAAYAIALERIAERINQGDKPRSDGFFDTDEGERSAAEEILEGILLAAQREYEEKKVKLYGKLLANLAFKVGIDRGYANFLLGLAQRISYRQLCIISLFGRKEEMPELTPEELASLKSDLSINSFRVNSQLSKDMIVRLPLKMAIPDIASEIQELRIYGIFEEPFLDPAISDSYRQLDLSAIAKILFNLMELKSISITELETIAGKLGFGG